MSGLIGQVGARSGVVGSTTDGTQLDYEEGTFEFAFGTVYGSGASAISSTKNTGRYIKVGTQVHLQGTFEITQLTSTSDGFTLNIPFAAADTIEHSDNSIGTISMSGGMALATDTSTNWPVPYIARGASVMNLYLVRGGSTWISLVPAMTVSSVAYSITISITYIVA